MITEDNKKKILAAIAANRGNYPSDAKHAASLGITTSVYSSLKNGQTERVLSDANWISIARRLGVNLRGEMEWRAAQTATFKYVTAQLEFCQSASLSGILCDIPNIGKTFTARHYVANHANAIYIDCSQVKTKVKMVKKIASEFGVGTHGRYADMYEDLVYYLLSGDFMRFLLIENQCFVIFRCVRWARRGHKNENFGPVKNPKILRFCNLKIAKLNCDQSVSLTYLSNGRVKDYAFALQI